MVVEEKVSPCFGILCNCTFGHQHCHICQGNACLYFFGPKKSFTFRLKGFQKALIGHKLKCIRSHNDGEVAKMGPLSSTPLPMQWGKLNAVKKKIIWQDLNWGNFNLHHFVVVAFWLLLFRQLFIHRLRMSGCKATVAKWETFSFPFFSFYPLLSFYPL